MTTEQILESALALPESDRARLAAALLASLDEAEAETGETFRATLDRRAEEARAGTVEMLTWAEVKRRARERAGA